MIHSLGRRDTLALIHPVNIHKQMKRMKIRENIIIPTIGKMPIYVKWKKEKTLYNTRESGEIHSKISLAFIFYLFLYEHAQGI
jgi:hypothetical protein